MRIVTLTLILLSSQAWAQTYNLLWSFGGAPNDGAGPVSSLVADKVGNLYGTTQFGGNATSFACALNGGCGTVFELSPNGSGGWIENVIYNFCSNYQNNMCLDGSGPVAGLVSDSAGNLYGTTYAGGNCANESGCGTVFELFPPQAPTGAWTEEVLYD